MTYRIVFIITLLIGNFSFSQINPGSTCDEAGCSISGSYPSLTNIPDMGTYDCLFTTPNPNWIAIGVQSAGNIQLNISQNGDVDFAAYGPYSSVSDGCPIGPNTPTIDCSYSASATETVFIPNAQAGEVYIILITNYSNAAGTISVVPSGGTAGINCNINFSADMTMTPSTCGQANGTATATPNGGTNPYTYVWDAPGNPTTQTITGLLPGTYNVTVTSSPSPDGTTYNPVTESITVTNNSGSFSGSTTLVSCPGGNDGTATATMTPEYGNVSYSWNDPSNQTTQTATGLAAGNYTCTVTTDLGCQGTVDVTVSEISPMNGNIVNQSDVTCNSGNDGIIEVAVTQGSTPYVYSWNNSSSTDNIATDLYAGNHTVTVTDSRGCIITIDGNIGEPSALDITSLTPNTQICPEDDILLEVSGTGGSSPHTFTWSEGTTVLGTGESYTVDPDVTNTKYCVVLSEECGSPTDEECVTITFPTPIPPAASPDAYQKCQPGYFEITNDSPNGSEIANTIWDFGSQRYYQLEQGNDSISMTFYGYGQYDLVMTNTSIYGCVYSDTLENFLYVIPSPEADFLFSDNPASMFNTTVTMTEYASIDVINWNWYSPYSSPSTSALEDPTFIFPDGQIGQYPVTLAVANEYGCVDTITKILNVVEDIIVFAPNTFTPDGDEFNQYWRPHIQGINAYNFDLFVFDRWGELVWESHDPNASWDGTYKGGVLPSGTYIWTIKVSSQYSDIKQEYNGFVTILH